MPADPIQGSGVPNQGRLQCSRWRRSRPQRWAERAAKARVRGCAQDLAWLWVGAHGRQQARPWVQPCAAKMVRSQDTPKANVGRKVACQGLVIAVGCAGPLCQLCQLCASARVWVELAYVSCRTAVTKWPGAALPAQGSASVRCVRAHSAPLVGKFGTTSASSSCRAAPPTAAVSSPRSWRRACRTSALAPRAN